MSIYRYYRKQYKIFTLQDRETQNIFCTSVSELDYIREIILTDNINTKTVQI